MPRIVKFIGSFKNRIVSKNFEEILGKDLGNCNEILQNVNTLNFCGETVYVLYHFGE